MNPFRKEICESYGIEEPEKEYRFHPGRKWRADFAWPRRKLLLEIEGGVYSMGRHTRGAGYVKDLEKYNAACELGYRMLRYVPSRIDYRQIKRVLDELA